MKNHSFSGRSLSATGSAYTLRAVTPDDAADLPDGMARGLFVGAAGDVVLLDASGAAATLTSNAAQYHPIYVSRVLATGTTAGGIVALY
jgi:hypothetical protein